MVTKRCFSLGAIGKMLPAKCCMLEEKVSLERCFQKDAIGKMLLWALSERCSLRCYRKCAVGKMLPTRRCLDAVCCMKKMSPLGAVGETS